MHTKGGKNQSKITLYRLCDKGLETTPERNALGGRNMSQQQLTPVRHLPILGKIETGQRVTMEMLQTEALSADVASWRKALADEVAR